jgi:hypothetical protein
MQISRDGLEHLVKDTRVNPLLEPPMARLVRRIAVREVLPTGTRAQDPQNAVHDVTGWAPWSAWAGW